LGGVGVGLGRAGRLFKVQPFGLAQLSADQRRARRQPSRGLGTPAGPAGLGR